MNILHIPEWYPHPEDDMAGIFIEKHIQAISSRHRCCVIYPMSRTQKKNIELLKTTKQGIPVYYAFYKRKTTGIELIDTLLRKFFYVKAIKKAISRMRKEVFIEDLLHLHVVERNGVFVKRFYSKPYVITEHWSKFLHPNKHPFDPKVYNESKAISAVSSVLKQGMQKWGIRHKNFKIIENVVDENTFFYKEHSTKRDFFQLLHVSEFNEEAKNILGILESLSDLKKSGKNVRLVLVGYGKDESLILDKIKILQLENEVDYKGKLYPESISTLMHQSDALIVNSRYETFGIVILESLLCGCPVIATPVGIAPDVLHEGNGVLVQGTLSESILLAMQSQYDRFVIANELKDRYSVKAITQKFSEIYLHN